MDGCGPETSKLPVDWRNRISLVSNKNTNGAIGFCIHPSDAAYAKLFAGRPKGLDYVEVLFKENIVRSAEIESHLKSESDYSVRLKIEQNLSIVRSREKKCRNKGIDL